MEEPPLRTVKSQIPKLRYQPVLGYFRSAINNSDPLMTGCFTRGTFRDNSGRLVLSEDRFSQDSKVDRQLGRATFPFARLCVERQKWNLAIAKITTGQVMFDQEIDFRGKRLVLKRQ